GPGDDRSPLAFRRRDAARGSCHSSAEHCAFPGRIRRWLNTRPTELFEHVLPDPICGDLAGPCPEHAAASRLVEIVKAGIFYAAICRFSGADAGTTRRRDRRNLACGDERRE